MWDSLWSPQWGLQLPPWPVNSLLLWGLSTGPSSTKEDFSLIFHWQWPEWPICCLLRSERSGQVHFVATCFSPQWPISGSNRSINNVSVFPDCFVSSFSFSLLIEILQPPFVSWAPARQAEALTARVFLRTRMWGTELIWDCGNGGHRTRLAVSLA